MITQKNALPNLIHTFTVDASYNAKKDYVGIGLVLQATEKPARRGRILDMIEETYQIKGLSKEMEKFAVFRALKIATERGYQRIKIRSDYNSMRRNLKKKHQLGFGLEQDDLTGQVLRLAGEFIEVKFVYCPRRKNQMAHLLSRKASQINIG